VLPIAPQILTAAPHSSPANLLLYANPSLLSAANVARSCTSRIAWVRRQRSFATLAWMKHKHGPSALAVSVATAHFFALLPRSSARTRRPCAVRRTSKPVLIACRITPARLHVPNWPGRTLWELTRLSNTIYARASNTLRQAFGSQFRPRVPRRPKAATKSRGAVINTSFFPRSALCPRQDLPD
jgi:hypothetical protein